MDYRFDIGSKVRVRMKNEIYIGLIVKLDVIGGEPSYGIRTEGGKQLEKVPQPLIEPI